MADRRKNRTTGRRFACGLLAAITVFSQLPAFAEEGTGIPSETEVLETLIPAEEQMNVVTDTVQPAHVPETAEPAPTSAPVPETAEPAPAPTPAPAP